MEDSQSLKVHSIDEGNKISLLEIEIRPRSHHSTTFPKGMMLHGILGNEPWVIIAKAGGVGVRDMIAGEVWEPESHLGVKFLK